MLTFDLLIPSHGWIYPIMHLITSLSDQKVLPTRVVVLVWKECLVVEVQEFATMIHAVVDPLGIELIIQHAYYSDHEQGRGVGYDRWFLINQAKSEYLCTIDEDNVLGPWQLDAWIAGYFSVIETLGHEAIVSPTIMREGTIQSQWITAFSYLFPKYTYARCANKPRHEVKMIWANSLFWRTEVFQSIQFDPLFVGSYEDIDFSSRVVQAGYAVVVLRDVQIDHRESKKTFLGELFLGTPQSAYYRSKNRILRIRKTATLWQKIQYFGCWLWVQTAGRIWYIYRSWVRQKTKLLRAIWQGIFAWMTQRISHKHT